MSSLRCLLSLAAVLLVAAGTIHGQNSNPTDPSTTTQTVTPEKEEDSEAPKAAIEERIVVSANRLETPVRTVGSSVTVIEREEIERREKATVLELLRTVPGIEVTQTGGPGKVASVFIRGGNSSHTLVLIDGVRVNSNTTGAFNFADLTTDNIERIEVLRGPQGTLYGSEAVAGVISITTRRGEPGVRFTGEAAAGSHDFRHARFSVEGGHRRFDYSLSLSDLSTEGVSAASERAGNTEKDPHDNFNLSSRLGFPFLGDGRVDLTARYVEGKTDLDGFTFGVGPTDDPNFRQEREALYANLQVKKRFAGWWSQTFAVGLADDDLLGEDPDTFFNNFDIRSRITQFTSQSDLALAPSDTLTFGYSVERRDGRNVGNFDETVYLRSAFLQNQWSWRDRLFLTGGLRHDDHSEFGEETTYRLTASLLFPRTASRLHGSFGTGFKAPTFNELFFPGFGNPDLVPETSRGFDLGVEQSFLTDRVTLDVTYFETEFEDLIGFDFTTFRANNIARADSEGFEILVGWRPNDRFQLSASHTYNETEDLSRRRSLPRRPRNRSTLQIDFQAGRSLAGAAALFVVRDRIDSDGRPMDDYERVDLALRYQATRRLQPYLRVENLFDDDYEEVTGFTTPGFHGVVGLRVTY